MGFYEKQPASRILLNQLLQYTNSNGTLNSSAFTSETYQIRVLSTIGGWISVDGTTGMISSSTGGTLIAANTAQGDYFTVTPGQRFSFASTTTASGTISVTEMS